MLRQGWIDPGEAVAVVEQCVLAGVCRDTVYAQQWPPVVDASDLLHSRLIDEEYTRQDTRFPKRSLRSRRKTADRLLDYRASLLGLSQRG